MNTAMQLPDRMIQSGLVRGAGDGLKPGKHYRVNKRKFRGRTCVYIGPHALPSNTGRRIAGEWSGRIRVQFTDTKREAVVWTDQLAPAREAGI
jgi:hypothetical protein